MIYSRGVTRSMKGLEQKQARGPFLARWALQSNPRDIITIYFSPQFRGIQLVVTVLSHGYNSRTYSGEAKVKSPASPETRPSQNALLLDTMPA